MKKKLSFVASLLMLSALSLTAEKLSPDMQLLLDTRASVRPSVTIKSDNALEGENVEVFVSLADAAAFDQLLAVNGVQVHANYGTIVTAAIDIAALDAVTAIEGVKYVQLCSPVRLCNDFSRRDLGINEVHSNSTGSLPRTYTGEGVVVGMIDTGVEFRHPAFFTADGKELRIRRVWDQNVETGPRPEGFDYGVEYRTPESIKAKTADSYNSYHASHTTNIAAGGDRRSKYYGVAPDADIVFVSFSEASNTKIADAIKYIFDYADEVDKPCVINMSLGSHYGPHDGTSYLDQIIDQLVGPGRIVVGAVGNEGESRLYATKTFTSTDLTLKTLLTLQEDMAAQHKQHMIDIWGEPGTTLKVNFAVVNSLKGQIMSRSDAYTTGVSTTRVYHTNDIETDGIDFSGFIYGEVNPESNRPHVWISSTFNSASTGRMIGLEVTGDAGSTVHMWNVGQHEFSSNGKSGWTNGTNACTVGEIGGTAKRIITVGSYDGRDSIIWIDGAHSLMSEIADYEQYHHSIFSSYGPTADGRMVPHILAPGFPVISAINRYAYPGDYLNLYTSEMQTNDDGEKFYYAYDMGTSMSAPFVAGTIALMLQVNPMLTPEEAKDVIMSTANTSSYMSTLPNNTYGAGRLNTLACIQKLVSLDAIDNIGADNEHASQVWADRAAGTITISSPGSVQVKVYNISGALIGTFATTSAYETIDASAWGHGVFVAVLNDGTNTRSFKLSL